MARVIITLKIMPSSPEEDISKLEQKAKEIIEEFGGKYHSTEIEPVAFGLKAIIIVFVLDESKGTTETMENNISLIEGVNSVEIIGITRALG